MSIIWSYKAPAHKKGGPTSLVTPQKRLVGVVRHLIKAFHTLWIYYIYVLQPFSVKMTRHKMTHLEDIAIHFCCQLHPSLVLLLYDHVSPGTSLQIRQSVTKETRPVVAQQCLGSTLPMA